MMQTQSPWNSLEITKLVIQVLTPLALLFLGIWVNRIAHRIEAVQWTNQKVVEKRITIYDEMAPLLNDLYCYFRWVGNWKELTPKEIIEIKRNLDKEFYIYKPLFSPDFETRYDALMRHCFLVRSGQGLDAKLRTSIKSVNGDRKEAFPAWDDSWDKLFAYSVEDDDQRKKIYEQRTNIKDAYDSFLSRFSQELSLGLDSASRQEQL